MLGPPKTLGMTRRAYVTFGAPGRRELFRAVCNVRDVVGTRTSVVRQLPCQVST